MKTPKGDKKAQHQELLKRQKLQEKAIEGAKKAVTEYREVFERLAEYDRK